MNRLLRFRRGPATRMNVPVHQIMFTPDRDARLPSEHKKFAQVQEELRTRYGFSMTRGR